MIKFLIFIFIFVLVFILLIYGWHLKSMPIPVNTLESETTPETKLPQPPIVAPIPNPPNNFPIGVGEIATLHSVITCGVGSSRVTRNYPNGNVYTDNQISLLPEANQRSTNVNVIGYKNPYLLIETTAIGNFATGVDEDNSGQFCWGWVTLKSEARAKYSTNIINLPQIQCLGSSRSPVCP